MLQHRHQVFKSTINHRTRATERVPLCVAQRVQLFQPQEASLPLGRALLRAQPSPLLLRHLPVPLRRWSLVEVPCRSEEHTSELQSLMRISYAVFCLKKKKTNKTSTQRCKTENTPIDPL